MLGRTRVSNPCFGIPVSSKITQSIQNGAGECATIHHSTEEIFGSGSR